MDDDLCESIKMEYMEATEKKDYDLILKKYNLKMRKNNKTVSPMRVKLEVKKAIDYAYFPNCSFLEKSWVNMHAKF